MSLKKLCAQQKYTYNNFLIYVYNNAVYFSLMSSIFFTYCSANFSHRSITRQIASIYLFSRPLTNRSI